MLSLWRFCSPLLEASANGGFFLFPMDVEKEAEGDDVAPFKEDVEDEEKDEEGEREEEEEEEAEEEGERLLWTW